MISSVASIKYDSTAGAWTDGSNFVKGSIIRRYAMEKMGRKQARGRLTKNEISAFFLDKYGVSADVE